MSLLGKILAVLNLAGLAGFFYVAALDYAKRQSWAYAVFRQDLLIQGLPLDETDSDTEGRPIVDRIGEQTGKDLFPQGNAVESQEKEVQRLQGEVRSLAGQPAAAGRKGLNFYATLLLPFAQTNSEREHWRACREYMADDKKAEDLKQQFVAAWLEAQQEVQRERKKDVDPQPPTLHDAALMALDLHHLERARPFVEDVLAALPADVKTPNAQQVGLAFDQAMEALRAAQVKELDGLFADALKRGPKVAESTRPDPARQQDSDLRRQRIAHLLFNLYGSLEEARGAQPGPDNLDENPVYRRFLTVVGLHQATLSVREEAGNLEKLAWEVETARGRDRSLFAAENDILLVWIRERAARVESEAALLVRTKQLVDEHLEQVKKRRRDVEQAMKELREAQAATMKELKDLRQKTADLFGKRLELRNNTDENQKLEKEIRKLEDEVSPRR